MSDNFPPEILEQVLAQDRKIIHIDMDCFFAAVEIRDNPDLVGKPVAVGGSPTGRGVLSTCNYEARKFGLHSAMSSALALKKCPEVIFVRHNFYKYKEASQIIRSIFEEFTSKIEPLSLDEAYLDVSDCQQFHGSATLIAKEIQKRIFEKTKLTASAGIAPNKLLAKIASDWNKPNGLTLITPPQIPQFITSLPLKKINGVGKVTVEKLKSHNLHTCGDLQKLSKLELTDTFGKLGQGLAYKRWGLDNREVGQGRVKSKSFSLEHTFNRDKPDLEACLDTLPILRQDLADRWMRWTDKLEGAAPEITTFIIKLRFNDFSRVTAEKTLELALFKPFYDSGDFSAELIQYTRDLLKDAWQRKGLPVRLMGIGLRLKSDPPENGQLSLFQG
ncbi:MAG: DNA polymerase IV [Halobacteriovoraceae bacterium]|nr:DNA polymerase IV [Halobacteriovoraceae bacterium]